MYEIETFGGAGRWRPLYAPELAISEMVDKHLVNAVLWIDKQIAAVLDKAMESPARLTYLVRKSKELRDECGKRRLCVPVGTEPPFPTEHEFTPQKKVSVNAKVIGSLWATHLMQKEMGKLLPDVLIPNWLPLSEIFAMREGNEYKLQFRIAPDTVHDITTTMDRTSAVALADALNHILSEGF